MLASIICRISLYKARRRWRRENPHNYTYMAEEFNPNLVSVGRGSYGLIHVINFSDHYKLSIGNYCSIAGNVYFIVCGEHRMDTISTYPFKAYYCHHKYEATSKGNIVVNDDVWIGENVTILSGITIGQGSVIAAGSVVTKDVPPYSIVCGNPAKVIKKRFNDDLIKELMHIDYSTLDESQILTHEDDLYKPLVTNSQLEWLPKKNKQ